MRPLPALTLMAALTACSGQQPEPEPTPAVLQAVGDATRLAEEQLRASGSRDTVFEGTIRILFVPVPEDVYVDLAVAAAGWTRGTISSRSIGVYQPRSAPPVFRRAVEAVTQRYAFRPIVPGEFSVVCGAPARQQNSVTRQSATCSMKHVNAVVQFSSVRMTRDSGFVGLGITRVPSGATRAETVYYCISLAKKDDKWDALRSERMVDPTRCPRGWA